MLSQIYNHSGEGKVRPGIRILSITRGVKNQEMPYRILSITAPPEEFSSFYRILSITASREESGHALSHFVNRLYHAETILLDELLEVKPFCLVGELSHTVTEL